MPKRLHLVEHDPGHLADDVAAPATAFEIWQPSIGVVAERGGARGVSSNLYSMDRKISVVMTRQLAEGLMVMSPVISPTSGNISPRSRNFWLDSALRGDV